MTPSPCIRICVLDPPSGLCRGCGRSMAELEAWTRLDEPARAAIVAALPARLEALRAVSPPPARSRAR